MSKKFLFLNLVLLFATSRQTKAISLIETVIIAGGSTAIAYLNNKQTNLDEKINLILDIEKHFSREFEDIMHRERTKQFAAKYEKTTYLQEITENNESLKGIQQKKKLYAILLILNGLLCAGIITKNIGQSLFGAEESPENPQQTDEATQKIQESIRLLEEEGYHVIAPRDIDWIE